MSVVPVSVALLLGLLAVPISYSYTQLCRALAPASLLGVAGAIMTVLLISNLLITKSIVKDKMYYGFAMFMFSCVIDLLVGLEIDGFVTGFMTLYLQHGEPYLASAWGAVVSYWDSTVFFGCYIAMAYLSSNGRSYRTTGLHWAAGILNSMVVLLLGACLSGSGLGWCTLLNVPYVLFPLAVAMRCLSEPLARNPAPTRGRCSWLDLALVLLLVEAALAAVLKGLAAVGSQQYIPSWYRNMSEPVLQQEEPAPFAAIQGLITLFYFLPGYLIVAWGLFVNPAQTWLRDLAVILAGATLHAGGSTVGMVYHGLTKAEHRVPSTVNHSAFWAFWAVNSLISIVPQIVAVRLVWLPVETTPQTSKASSKSPQKSKKKTTKKFKEN